MNPILVPCASWTRRRFVAAAAAIALMPSGTNATPTATLPARFDPKRDAAADLATALDLAARTHRRVIVDVGGEWCPWCHIMDRFFARHTDLAALRDRDYVWLKVNMSKENTNAALLSRWPKVSGYPHLFVLASDGTLVHSQDTSVLEAGSDYDPASMRAFLERWSPNGAGAGRARPVRMPV